MGLFSKKKKDEGEERHHTSHEDAKALHPQIHDPILTAIQEQQPYEVGSSDPTQSVSPSGALRDVFGHQITNPDISNPARSREERPLDTIRSFEYSATGDESLREMQETPRLGFRPREQFSSMPRFDTNPYAQDENIISFGDPSAAEAENERKNVYYPPTPQSTTVAKQKKKKGLFRRNKGDDDN